MILWCPACGGVCVFWMHLVSHAHDHLSCYFFTKRLLIKDLPALNRWHWLGRTLNNYSKSKIRQHPHWHCLGWVRCNCRTTKNGMCYIESCAIRGISILKHKREFEKKYDFDHFEKILLIVLLKYHLCFRLKFTL